MLDLISNSMRKTGLPLKISREAVNDWWKSLSLGEGEFFFFTGLLYQLTPYIESTVEKLEKIENSRAKSLLPLLKALPQFFVRTAIRPRSKGLYSKIVKSVYELLRSSGVSLWYEPKLDYYSGVLLYDLGEEELFEEHANFVTEKLEKGGVKKLVTIDPHTTYALRELYPKFVGRSFKVVSYIELLENSRGFSREKVVLHDPCYYARYLNLHGKLRSVLENFGVEFSEVRNSREMTSCCGGPIESLSATLSREIARVRVEELNGGKIVTACPICLSNLKRAGGDVVDLAILLFQGASSTFRNRR